MLYIYAIPFKSLQAYTYYSSILTAISCVIRLFIFQILYAFKHDPLTLRKLLGLDNMTLARTGSNGS